MSSSFKERFGASGLGQAMKTIAPDDSEEIHQMRAW
jgi:hypothetical protein